MWNSQILQVYTLLLHTLLDRPYTGQNSNGYERLLISRLQWIDVVLKALNISKNFNANCTATIGAHEWNS